MKPNEVLINGCLSKIQKKIKFKFKQYYCKNKQKTNISTSTIEHTFTVYNLIYVKKSLFQQKKCLAFCCCCVSSNRRVYKYILLVYD